MPFENALLAKLFESILEGREVAFRGNLLPKEEALSAIRLLPIPLSRRQHEAVYRAWMHEISYIQGPPGTGKSHTITAIMLAALFLKKRVLLVSHKKPAIDVVFQKLVTFLGPGAVIYASNDSDQRKAARGDIQNTLSRTGTLEEHAELDELRRRRKKHRVKVAEILEEISGLENRIKGALNLEREYFLAQEAVDRNRKSFVDQFGAQHRDFSKTSDVRKAGSLLLRTRVLLEEFATSNGGKLPRKDLLFLRLYFRAAVKFLNADPAKLSPTPNALHYLQELLEITAQCQAASDAFRKVIPDFLRELWDCSDKTDREVGALS